MQSDSFQIARRYIVQRMLGKGGMGAVYEATDRLNNQTIALKKVVISTEQLMNMPDSDSDFRIALSDEFRTLASLRHPNIISVLDYGFDDKQPYFTMELIDAPRTILEAGKNAALDAQVRLLIELLQALIYLHRRGILHRDLKPGNVLVTSDGTVKVLDFGLSLMTTYSQSKVQESTAGTLAYMAPELLSDEPASVASDLYAVGVIACELLTGHHPFNLKNVGLLVTGILSAPPDLSGLDSDLSEVVARLLDKQPHNRYENATDVIRDLCSAIGQPSPVESHAIRESFLQAAKFVGRQAELRKLREVLDDTVNTKSERPLADSRVPKAWLIGGESGVGKSRLLDEFRTRALVNGMLVLRGQAITEGNVPYQMWHDPLRRLVLSVDLPDDDASILKSVIPDIEVLLARTVIEPPALDAKAGRNRFMRVVRDLFRANKHSTSVILEDLQWASDEDIELLKSLIPLTTDSPLLLIASYRDDERPDLPVQLAEMEVLKLKRLDVTGISELCTSILGSAVDNPRLVERLYKETEGNVFFLIEVVRALAELAGEIDLINVDKLPSNFLPDGIQNAVSRRLNRVPSSGHPLLQLAALAGRVLDLTLLSEFTSDLDTWLEQCSSSGVLEVEQDRWRFAHDKLREGILASIEPYELPQLHLRLAQKLEQIYADDVNQIPAIARHYQQAGIHERAIPYFIRAAELAQKSYSNENAIAAATAVLESIEYLLQSNPDLPEWHDTRVQMIELLGDLAEMTGHSEDSRQWFQKGIAFLHATDVIRLSRFYRKWGNTWVTQRRPEEALSIYENAQNTLAAIKDEPTLAWWSEWINLNLDLIWANYWLFKPQVMKELIEALRSKIDTFGTPLQRSRFFRSWVLLAIQTYSAIGNMPDETRTYAQMQLEASRVSGDLLDGAYAQFTWGFIHQFYQEWSKAEVELKESLRLSEQIGASEYRLLSLIYLTVSYRQLGNEELVEQFAQRSLLAATEANLITYIAVSKANQAWLAWRRGDYIQAQDLAESALDLWLKIPSPFPLQWLALWPLIGVANSKGNIPEIIAYMKKLFAPGQYNLGESMSGSIRALIDVWETDDMILIQSRLTDVINLANQLNYL